MLSRFGAQFLEMPYFLARRAVKAFGYHIEVNRYASDGFRADTDPVFLKLLERHSDKTMVNWRGLLMAFQAIRHVTERGLPGAVVECGVWRGGCSLIMAEAAQHFGDEGRSFYLFDTYAGMSEPTDLDASAHIKVKDVYAKSKRDGYVDWCYASLEDVEANVTASTYPRERFHLIKGKVEDTIPEVGPVEIALLRLDTDWYESTRHELIHFYPRLVEGGLLICDDYSDWDGARRAVDEYFDSLAIRPYLHVDSGSGRAIAVKPAGG